MVVALTVVVLCHRDCSQLLGIELRKGTRRSNRNRGFALFVFQDAFEEIDDELTNVWITTSCTHTCALNACLHSLNCRGDGDDY